MIEKVNGRKLTKCTIITLGDIKKKAEISQDNDFLELCLDFVCDNREQFLKYVDYISDFNSGGV